MKISCQLVRFSTFSNKIRIRNRAYSLRAINSQRSSNLFQRVHRFHSPHSRIPTLKKSENISNLICLTFYTLFARQNFTLSNFYTQKISRYIGCFSRFRRLRLTAQKSIVCKKHWRLVFFLILYLSSYSLVVVIKLIVENLIFRRRNRKNMRESSALKAVFRKYVSNSEEATLYIGS